MSFKEYIEVDEIVIAPAAIAVGRVGLGVAVRLGKEIAKLALPPLSINSAIKATVIYSIAKKYDLTTIIEIQKFGIGLIMDVAAWIGVEISAKLAASIFTKITAIGVVTLGAILISVFTIFNKNKAKDIIAKATKRSADKKKNLSTVDINNIRKELQAAA